MNITMTPLRFSRTSLVIVGILLGLGLSVPGAACNFDGVAGSGHGGFGAWGQLTANRHMTQSIPYAGNRDNGDNVGGGDSNEEGEDNEGSEQIFDVLPGPAVEVRESGGSIHVEEMRDNEPIDVHAMR